VFVLTLEQLDDTGRYLVGRIRHNKNRRSTFELTVVYDLARSEVKDDSTLPRVHAEFEGISVTDPSVVMVVSCPY
jgi:hypothetical protein